MLCMPPDRWERRRGLVPGVSMIRENGNSSFPGLVTRPRDFFACAFPRSVFEIFWNSYLIDPNRVFSDNNGLAQISDYLARMLQPLKQSLEI